MFTKGYREGSRLSYKKETDIERVERNIPGRYPTLHIDLALPIHERQARDGHLRGAVGPDGTQLGTDSPRRRRLRLLC